MHRPVVLLAAMVALTVVTATAAPFSAWAAEWPALAGGHRYQHMQAAAGHGPTHSHSAGDHDHAHPAMQELRTEALGARQALAVGTSTRSVAPLFGNLGSHHHPITTASPEAQRYFDEGLILTFGFNHAEAIRSFRDGITLDPSCAMCYWGVALALGPNINAPMDAAAVPDALAAIEKATALAPAVSPAEQAYIMALSVRYSGAADADRTALDLTYVEAMRDLSARYPDDDDAATLFAEALMNLSPWAFWTVDGEPTNYTAQISTTLEAVLAQNPNHPGANHFYIHTVEASRTPERAIPSAERLETLVPGAGHLTHMPAHVYWRVGRYADAARVNEEAIRVDEALLRRGVSGADQGSHAFYSLVYYPHNVHFLFAAAHMDGRGDLALRSARKLVEVIPAGAYQEIPALEDFRPMPIFALVRFGKWEQILDEPQPAAELQYTTGIWHWARGLAYSRLGDTDAAESELAMVASIAKTDAMKEQTLASFPKASTMLEIAQNILAGELAAARGATDEAITLIEAAVAVQDGLSYIEPPAWFYPARHNLGAILLAAGRPAEAEAVYRADLAQYPNNGWSLFGLVTSLRDQGKAAEAADIDAQFAQSWQRADAPLTGSRY